MKKIPKPCKKEVKKYLANWEKLENYKFKLQESSLNKLFFKTYKNNNCLDDILIKVCSLNDLYGTNIFSTISVARNILSLKIDKKLESGDLGLVNKIAKVKIGGKNKNFYSFATKYCSHHKPMDYPIYDSNVEKVLMHFLKKDKFYEFKKGDLRNYPKFKDILLKFREYYNLGEYNLKDIDKYLFQVGRKYFKKNFKKGRQSR